MSDWLYFLLGGVFLSGVMIGMCITVITFGKWKKMEEDDDV